MHDSESSRRLSLRLDKLAYYQWRESWTGYEDCDSYIDEDRQLRNDLKITQDDDINWDRIKESAFRVEF